MELSILGLTTGNSSDSDTTITIQDAVSPNMEDFDMYDSFYGTHIFGGRYHDELRPSSLTRVPNLRMNLSNIDPLVHQRSSSSLSGRAAKVDSSKSVREFHHSLGHSQYRPLQKTLASSHGRETIFSPPPLPTRRYAKIKPDETYKKTRYTSETEMRVQDIKLPGTIDHPTWTNVYYPKLHMTDKRETTHQKNQTHQAFRGQSDVLRFKRDDDMYGLAETGHQSAEEDSSGQYRTVLYVVPTSPKSQSPSHFVPQSTELTKTRLRNSPRPRACNENGNTCINFDSSEVPLKAKSTKEGHRSDNSGSSIDGGSFVDDGFSSDQNIPYEPPKSKIIFQGPGRYLETKVYCKTIPTPQSMEVTKKINGLHNANRSPENPIRPAHNPLRVIRNDYNQIVVDIKPRHLNEADKQQHVSQWIQVGTLGDTVQSKMDRNEAVADENDILDPIDVEDATDDVDVDVLHGGKKFFNKTSNSCTFDVEMSPNRSKADWFASPPLDTASKSNVGMTPLSLQTRSTSDYARTNPSDNRVIKVCQSSNKESAELSSLVNEEKTDNLGPRIQENHNLSFKRTFSPISDNITPVNIESPRVTALTYGQNDVPRENESINWQANKMKPELAPKPLPGQKLRALLEKHTEASALSEAQQAINRTTSRYPNHSSQADHMPGANLNTLASIPVQEKLSDDKSEAAGKEDTPTQKVRNLAAYFTDIINKNKSESEFKSLRRMRVRDSVQKDITNENDIPTCSSPFFRTETPEDRERRLRAVDALRHRTLPLRTVDYTCVGQVNNTKSFLDSACEDYYPYVRPSSVPRPRPRCITTNITRNSTNLN
ncbi:inositol 5-phosphatase [Clonorchis sinensis]|uniref:Inositol 5-phosphatase n=1 Tax=Clonorchis sinensis TaxID=79923 RepID=G7YR32_CLOSI|nr:inositol 5-phosphatase [Clonorchis sinensis]